MLSEETLDMSSVKTTATVLAFPTHSPWRLGPLAAGLAAAAACAIAVVGVKNRAAAPVAPVSAEASRPVAASGAVDVMPESISMKPVLFVRLPSDQAPRGAQGTFLADADAASPMAQLNWIGDIHLSPVAPSATGDFLLNPKTDLKAAVITDSQGARDSQEPVEMTAFRFQR